MPTLASTRIHLGRRAGFAGAALALAVGMMGTTLPTPLYALYRQRFGFSELMVTVIFATYAAGVIASLVAFGRLSDQIGRRRMLLPALGLSALSAFVFLLADGLPLLLLGRIISGLSAGIFTGTATATLVDLAPPERRSRATLVAAVANMGGLGLGVLLAGFLSQWVGSPLRIVFWVDLALLAGAAIGIWAMPEPVTHTSHPRLRARLPRIPSGMRSVFVRAALAGFAGFAVLGLFTAVTPDFLGQALGVTNRAAVGLVVFSVFAASTAGQAMLGLLPEDLALPAGCVGLIAGMALLALSLAVSSVALLVLAGVTAGLGQGLSFRAGLATLNLQSPSDQRAEVASSFFVVAYVAISLPVIGEGALAQTVSLRAAGTAFAAVVAGISVTALALLMRTWGHRDASSAGPVGRHDPRVPSISFAQDDPRSRHAA
jgi:predicted MFS family arabinose efflux permease